jgi:hypothetical protein
MTISIRTPWMYTVDCECRCLGTFLNWTHTHEYRMFFLWYTVTTAHLEHVFQLHVSLSPGSVWIVLYNFLRKYNYKLCLSGVGFVIPFVMLVCWVLVCTCVWGMYVCVSMCSIVFIVCTIAVSTSIYLYIQTLKHSC